MHCGRTLRGSWTPPAWVTFQKHCFSDSVPGRVENLELTPRVFRSWSESANECLPKLESFFPKEWSCFFSSFSPDKHGALLWIVATLKYWALITYRLITVRFTDTPEFHHRAGCCRFKPHWFLLKSVLPVKLNPPPKPNVNLSTISWLSQAQEHKKIKDYNAELQWKQKDQPWSVCVYLLWKSKLVIYFTQ